MSGHMWVRDDSAEWFFTGGTAQYVMVNGQVQTINYPLTPGQTVQVTVGSGGVGGYGAIAVQAQAQNSVQTAIHTANNLANLAASTIFNYPLPDKNEVCELCFLTRKQYSDHPTMPCWPEFGDGA